MHVKFLPVAACIVAALMFLARSLIARKHAPPGFRLEKKLRGVTLLLQIAGSCSAMAAVVMFLRS